MSNDLPFVSVIVAVYNAEKTIGRCLEHLLKLDYPDYEVIVVDNNSTDKTQELIQKYNVVYLFEEKRGWPAARNKAIRYSKARFIANIDSDCFADRNWLKILVSELISESRIGGVVGKTKVEKGKTLLEQYYTESVPFNIERYIGKSPYICWGGGNNVYKKEVFEKIGYYDSRNYTSGADIEFHQRLKTKSNYEIKYVSEAVIYHAARNSLKDLFNNAAKYTHDGILRTKQFPELRSQYHLFLFKKIKEILKNMAGFFYRSVKFFFGRETKLKTVSPLFSIVSYSGNLYGFLKAKIKLSLARVENKEEFDFAGIKKIAIIEPHYDDAWINLGGIILKHPEIEFKIISATEDKLNEKDEGKELEELLPNVKTQSLKYKGLELGTRISPRRWKREFCKINNLKSFAELNQRIEDAVSDADLVLLPLGISHPQHTLISEIKLLKPLMHYREFPYYFPSKIMDYRNFFMHLKAKWRHHLQFYLKLKNKKAVTLDIANVLRKKIEIFKQVYKSQLLILEDLDNYRHKLSELREEVLYRNTNRRRRVLILYLGHGGLDPLGIMAGAQGTTVQHAQFLIKNGFDVMVMTPLTCPDGDYNGVHYINVRDWLSIARALRSLRKHWNVVYSVGSPGLLRETYCLPYLQVVSLRILVIHSGLSGMLEPERVRVINRYADIVICVSEAIKGILINYGVEPEKIQVIYNGIDKQIFYPQALSRRMKRVIYAGALVSEKGISTLLHAFRKVKTMIPNAELVICGSSQLYYKPEYHVDSSLIPLDSSVRFLGAISHSELARVFSQAALAVFPSSKAQRIEGFGKVSIEAQACGCPAIVSDNGGLPETILDGITGRVFPSDDSDALASIITELLLSPEQLRNMSIEAAKRVKSSFLLEQTFKPLKMIIEQGMKNKGLKHYLRCIGRLIGLTLEKKNIGFIRYYKRGN